MRLLKFSNFLWGFVLALLLVLSIAYSFISTDAPYYLSMARDVSRGYAPYKDIFTSYTPVMMYLNSLVHYFIDTPSYKLLLTFQYFVITIGVVFFYQICRKEELERNLSIFLSLLLFIAILSSDGSYINLEVYVLLFTFIAYYLLIKKKFFWCGVFLALGFFSKQYGVFNFLPFFLLIIAYHGSHRSYLGKFILGGVLPLLVFLAYFVIIEQVEFTDLVLQLTGSGYDDEMIELETTWFRFLAGSKIFLLLLVPLFFSGIKPFRNNIDIILIIGILVNFLPLYIQTVSHYFLLTFPYVFILMARNLNLSNKRFLVMSNLILILIAGLLFTRIYKYRDVYSEQLKLAIETRKQYPVGSDVFLYKHFRFLYILNDYRNPVLEEIGYRYGFEPDDEFKKRYKVLSR
ncbi:hypothetical protein [Christiangramia portivictoriae]|uniref:hypothetical protein n=1 Tax=Christiangramia portivictoriae TaxID=326069 RepID=UPI0004075B06|nr:hypothetical protein [Christiangramia portivictoriae]